MFNEIYEIINLAGKSCGVKLFSTPSHKHINISKTDVYLSRVKHFLSVFWHKFGVVRILLSIIISTTDPTIRTIQ